MDPKIIPTPADQWIEVSPSLGAVQMYRLGGHEYPMKSVPQCKTCQLPEKVRIAVERAVLKGFAYTVIESHLPDGVDCNRECIRRHVDRGHMPIEETVRRAIIDQRAEELGFPEFEASLTDHVSFARVGLQRVFEEMQEGNLPLTIDHGIQFARLLKDAEDKAGEGVDQEEMLSAFMAFREAVMEVCDREQVAAIVQRVQQQQVLAGLDKKASAIDAASGS